VRRQAKRGVRVMRSRRSGPRRRGAVRSRFRLLYQGVKRLASWRDARYWLNQRPSYRLALVGLGVIFVSLAGEVILTRKSEGGGGNPVLRPVVWGISFGYLENLIASMSALGVSLTIGAPLVSRLIRRIDMQPWRLDIESCKYQLRDVYTDVATLIMPEQASEASDVRTSVLRQAMRVGISESQIIAHAGRRERLIAWMNAGATARAGAHESRSMFYGGVFSSWRDRVVKPYTKQLAIRRYLRLVRSRATTPWGVIAQISLEGQAHRPSYLMDWPGPARKRYVVWDRPPLPGMEYGVVWKEAALPGLSLKGLHQLTPHFRGQSDLDVLRQCLSRISAATAPLSTSPVGRELSVLSEQALTELARIIDVIEDWPRQEFRIREALAAPDQSKTEFFSPRISHSKAARFLCDYRRASEPFDRHPLEGFHLSSIEVLIKLLEMRRLLERI